MGLNIKQVYDANPSTSIEDNDLIYLGLSPFGLTDDSAIKYSDLYAQMGIAYQLTTLGSGFSFGKNGSLLNITNGGSPTTGTVLYSVDTLGNHIFNVNGTVSLPSTIFTPLQYVTGTMSQSGTTITGSGTTFTSAMSGGWIVPSSGNAEKFYFAGSTTIAGASLSQTISSGTTFTLYYYPSSDTRFNTDQSNKINIFSTPHLVTIGNTSTIFHNKGLSTTLTGLISNSSLDVTGISPTFVASQSGTTVTISAGTTFTTADEGRMILFATGQVAFITNFLTSTTATVQQSQTVPLCGFNIVGRSNNLYTVVDNSGNLGTFSLFLKGGAIGTPRTITTPAATITQTNFIVSCDTSGGAIAVTLPAGRIGQLLIFKDISGNAAANNITLTPASGNIDGAANKVMNTNYESVRIYYNGSEWSII